MRALPAEWGVDRSRFPFRPSPDNGKIFFFDTLLLHQQPEPPGCLRILSHKHEPARFPVEPVDDGNLTAIRYLKSEQLLQLAPECPRSIRFGGMDEEKRRLLDDEEIVALRDDREVARGVCAFRLRGG